MPSTLNLAPAARFSSLESHTRQSFNWRTSSPLIPRPNRLVRDRDTALGEQVVHIADTDREAVIQPDGVTVEIGLKSISSVLFERECDVQQLASAFDVQDDGVARIK